MNRKEAKTYTITSAQLAAFGAFATAAFFRQSQNAEAGYDAGFSDIANLAPALISEVQ